MAHKEDKWAREITPKRCGKMAARWKARRDIYSQMRGKLIKNAPKMFKSRPVRKAHRAEKRAQHHVLTLIFV
jgi:hypothetical protein